MTVAKEQQMLREMPQGTWAIFRDSGYSTEIEAAGLTEAEAQKALAEYRANDTARYFAIPKRGGV
jgi:hypothetical protein